MSMYDEVGPQFAHKLVQEGYTYVDGEWKPFTLYFNPFRSAPPCWGSYYLKLEIRCWFMRFSSK